MLLGGIVKQLSGYDLDPDYPEMAEALKQICDPYSNLYKDRTQQEKLQVCVEALLWVSPFEDGNHRTTEKVKRYLEDLYDTTIDANYTHSEEWDQSTLGKQIIRWFYEDINEGPNN